MNRETPAIEALRRQNPQLAASLPPNMGQRVPVSEISISPAAEKLMDFFLGEVKELFIDQCKKMAQGSAQDEVHPTHVAASIQRYYGSQFQQIFPTDRVLELFMVDLLSNEENENGES